MNRNRKHHSRNPTCSLQTWFTLLKITSKLYAVLQSLIQSRRLRRPHIKVTHLLCSLAAVEWKSGQDRK